MPGCDIPVTRTLSAPAETLRRGAYARFMRARKQLCGNTCAMTLYGAGHNSVTRLGRLKPSHTTGAGTARFMRRGTAFSAR